MGRGVGGDVGEGVGGQNVTFNRNHMIMDDRQDLVYGVI